ncbi:hypothetical protein KEM55_001880 [Ascosphaera atra]|nr:hypothetical protein KEM55_001880 [Ascosphaera atra]
MVEYAAVVTPMRRNPATHFAYIRLAYSASAKRASCLKVTLFSHSSSSRPRPVPRCAHCGAWLCVSMKPGIRNWPRFRVFMSAFLVSMPSAERRSLSLETVTSRSRWLILPSAETIIRPLWKTSMSVLVAECRKVPWKTWISPAIV